MTTIIDMAEADAYWREQSAMTHTSSRVYRMEGPRWQLLNHSFPHRVWVRDNMQRPYGHLPEQLGPRPLTVILCAEPAASGQVYADVPLTIGETVRLRWPDGSLSDPYVVTPQPLTDPVLVPASS